MKKEIEWKKNRGTCCFTIGSCKDIISYVQSEINDCIDIRVEKLIPPIYSSIDIRTASFKVAPVDTNIFPAGFNNMSALAKKEAAKLMREYFKKYFHGFDIKIIGLVGEDFTRNGHYPANLEAISSILKEAGYDVMLISLTTEEEEVTIDLENGKSLTIYASIKTLQYDGKHYLATSNGVVPDVIMLNNDLTSGISEKIVNISQPIVPNPQYGWFRRSKYQYFQIYNDIVSNIAKKFNFDPWFLTTYVDVCHNIDFKNKLGLEILAAKVDVMIRNVQKKYDEYNLPNQPYVFIKSDMGTFGLGITVVQSGDDVLGINKKTRHSVQNIKGGRINDSVILQECVPTDIKTTHDTDIGIEVPSEKMVYVVNGRIVDSFLRYNETKTDIDNLNSPGMKIKNIALTLTGHEILASNLAILASIKESKYF